MLSNLRTAAVTLLTLAPFAPLACTEPSAPGEAATAPDDPCAAAAAHLAACAVDLPAPEAAAGTPGAACDPEVATAVLATDCDTLATGLADRKADGPLAALACRLGFYASCPVPACPDAPLPAADQQDPTRCAAYLENFDDCGLCRYYDCRETYAQCGDDAYLIDYVGRYCRRFAQVTEPRVSPAANAWLKRVRRCLGEWLEENVAYDAACEDIDRRGTDSHAVCYVETGFCALSVADWLAIIHTIDVGDAPFRVMLATAQGCLGEWLGADDRP
ncbi:hypothetical protein L6V77_33910 [Myxococcota bacterium]|nr:hypothetical protein [Myxococcota bacterium]